MCFFLFLGAVKLSRLVEKTKQIESFSYSVLTIWGSSVHTFFKPLRHINSEQTIQKSKQIMLQAGKYFGMCCIKEPSYHTKIPKGSQLRIHKIQVTRSWHGDFLLLKQRESSRDMPKNIKTPLNYSDPQSDEKLHRSLTICIFHHRKQHPLWPHFDTNRLFTDYLKVHTFDLNNLNLLRINLIEKPQAEQVSSDLLLSAACTLLRVRENQAAPWPVLH